MKFWVSSEQGSPKNRAAGLVAGHQSFSCSELHHPSGLQGKRFVRFRIGFDYTCCKEGCEDNPEKLQKAGFPHMQTQGCTCLPSGTSPHAGESQPVSVTMHSGAPPLEEMAACFVERFPVVAGGSTAWGFLNRRGGTQADRDVSELMLRSPLRKLLILLMVIILIDFKTTMISMS